MITKFWTPELLEQFDLLDERVSQAFHIGLFTDFDGTLSPIVPVPADAELDPKIRPLLRELAGKPDVSVGIVSGRALSDLRARTVINGLIYVGNHGLEIEAGDDMQPWIRERALEIAQKYASFVAREGRKVVEIRPRLEWDKGHAIKWLLKEVLPASTLPIYIGDDVTDEDAFAAIPQGITIRVGGVPATGTQAQYLLPDVDSVAHFLSWLNHAKPNASAANAQRVGK